MRDPRKGTIALMGSGELAATMVEVHKELIAALGEPRRAAFLDTPAGFQLNADQISQKAVEYFRRHVRHPLEVVSFKSAETAAPFEAEKAYDSLRQADFVLVGPGSPTYALRQWLGTPIPEILATRVEAGGCLVAASAAALTVGRFTLPVYEIYKVGEPLHWVEGMDVLGRLGFGLVVIPHWNNAEGGTHDTRFCYMGELRLERLESLLPEDVRILGLDEHTACLLDLERDEAVVKGAGRVTLRRRWDELSFASGERFSLDVLRKGMVAGGRAAAAPQPATAAPTPKPAIAAEEGSGSDFWETVHALETAFHAGIEKREARESVRALLELDRLVWEAQQGLEDPELVSQAREVFRDLVVLFGVKLDAPAEDRSQWLAPLVGELLELRQVLRRSGRWEEADAIRGALQRANIVVEDTREGSRWHLLL
ncbi:MAG: hypothetical protein AB1640_13405 [bacterium]